MHLDPRVLANFQRACPLTHKALCGRRYLLPQKHQASFANQDAGIQRRVLTLLGSVLAPDKDSFARRSELLNLLVALRFDLPTLFLDPDLGQALLRTDLPPDFRTDDVRWPWPGFRLMTPLSLDLGRNGDRVVQYVDVALCQRDDRIRLDQKLLDDLYGGLQILGSKVSDYLLHGFTHPAAEVYVSGLTISENETVTFAHEWNSRVLRELIGADTGERPREERIRSLVFNTLLLLSQHPSTITLGPLEIVRSLKSEGAHFMPALARGPIRQRFEKVMSQKCEECGQDFVAPEILAPVPIAASFVAIAPMPGDVRKARNTSGTGEKEQEA